MAMSRAMRKSATARILLQNVLGHDGSFALRGCGFKTWSAVNVERSWPNPDANAAAPGGNAGPAVPEGSTSSREVDPSNPNSNQNAAGSYGQTSSWSSSSKPGTGKTWPNPNAPRDTPTYTPSSYSSSSKGGGKLWDNPNGLPYWDSKWDDPTKPELRAKGWTWDPNPANSHMGTWPADQPPPNRSPLGFSPRGGASWDRGPRQNFNQNAAPGGGGNFQGGGQGGQGGFPGGNQGGQGGGFPGGNQGGGGFPGGNQGGGGFPGGNQGGQGGFPGGNQGGQGGFPGGGQGGFPGGGQGGFPGGR